MVRSAEAERPGGAGAERLLVLLLLVPGRVPCSRMDSPGLVRVLLEGVVGADAAAMLPELLVRCGVLERREVLLLRAAGALELALAPLLVRYGSMVTDGGCRPCCCSCMLPSLPLSCAVSTVPEPCRCAELVREG